jgi:hypothetical protein
MIQSAVLIKGRAAEPPAKLPEQKNRAPEKIAPSRNIWGVE